MATSQWIPIFKDAAAGNFRLDYCSPCIDAADTTAAPPADFMGAPRYDDPRTPNSGVASAGLYADMGAYEFVETADSDVDLVVRNIVGPGRGRGWQTATIQWEIANIGSGTAVGPWRDAISPRTCA